MVDVVALKRASEAIVANFIRDNAIFCFGISKRVLYDNGTSFVSAHVQSNLKIRELIM